MPRVLATAALCALRAALDTRGLIAAARENLERKNVKIHGTTGSRPTASTNSVEGNSTIIIEELPAAGGGEINLKILCETRFENEEGMADAIEVLQPDELCCWEVVDRLIMLTTTGEYVFGKDKENYNLITVKSGHKFRDWQKAKKWKVEEITESFPGCGGSALISQSKNYM